MLCGWGIMLTFNMLALGNPTSVCNRETKHGFGILGVFFCDSDTHIFSQGDSPRVLANTSSLKEAKLYCLGLLWFLWSTYVILERMD